jgi:hypothetical protein
MSKALKRKQNKSSNEEAVNSFEKVIKKIKEDHNMPKASTSTPTNSDDEEEVEVIPKKKFQNNSKKEIKILSIKYFYILTKKFFNF